MNENIEALINSIANLRLNKSANALSEVQKNINMIFGDGRNCIDFIYTENVDKLPFGCMVTPSLNHDQINNILISGDEFVIKEYYVELDSKAFLYGLSDAEIASVILYNVAHMTDDSVPTVRLREAIDIYFTEHNTQLRINEAIQYEAILAYGLIDTLIKLTNCLYIDSEIVTDAKLDELGLADDFTSAMHKLFKKIPGCESVASRMPNMIVLDWCFRLYTNVETERIPAINQLKRIKSIAASELYARIVNNIVDALYRIDTDTYTNTFIGESYIMESKNKNGLLAQLKYSGLRGIEDDFYEFMIMARNAETEYEVMYALKQINARLAILEDYIRNTEMSEEEKKRWTDLYIRYINIREEIAKKKVYNRKNYGVFVDYNKLDQMSDDDAYDDSRI